MSIKYLSIEYTINFLNYYQSRQSLYMFILRFCISDLRTLLCLTIILGLTWKWISGTIFYRMITMNELHLNLKVIDKTGPEYDLNLNNSIMSRWRNCVLRYAYRQNHIYGVIWFELDAHKQQVRLPIWYNE